MVSVWKHILGVIVTLALASVLALVHAPAAYADLGDRVTNIATISQDANSGRLVFQTNEASFIIEARQTPSEIEFFRVVAGAPDAISITLNGSDYSPSGDPADAFLPIEGASGPSGVALNTPSTVPLVPTSTYLSGEIMVVRVIDTGQNGDPNVIETVLITVRADNGDRITLRLYEDGPNTGQFYAFFPSSAADTPQNDITITAPQDTVLTATYIDAFDATEVSVDTAFISPFGRVFDSFTGELLDGVAVTLIDVSTGLPATVLGVDGAGDFPARVLTGVDVTDSAGITYTSEPGAFFYPILAPGTYRLQVDAPEGYLYPSVRVAADFDGLQNAPFTIDDDASYSQDFTIAASGPLNLDVPLDPNGDLVVREEASEPAASVGDFVGYTVTLENEGNVPAPFTLRDNLPRGLRYVTGSVRLNGAVVGEPQILADGETLLFSGGLVLAGERARLTYLTSVGPGAQTGEAVNRAVAINSSGEELSNVAEAAVIIEEDLFSSRLTIVGRVADAACTPDDNWARELSDGKGIANVRIYMETGRYVVTDENGLFHFEGIEPGTHVVQLDEATLPKGYDPVVCEENSRYAGSAISKFVDAQGGTLWRANFYLERNGEALDVVDKAGAMLRDADKYDSAWLDGLTKVYPRWAYPALGQTPNARSLDLGFVHGPNDQVELRLNEKSVSGLNFAGRQVSKNRTLAISRWTGVDIQRGENRFEAVIYNQDGQVIERQGRTVWFVDEVNSARLVDDRSVTVADGRTKPVIAIRLEDGSGHAVHEGRLAEINVSEPYRLAQEAEQEFEAPVSAAFNAATGVSVGADGVALVELEPTLKSGRVRVQVKLNDGSLEEIDVWLQPEKREWVVVGLAEAEGLLSNIDGDGSDDLDEVSADGRIAFFAKGVIRGDWLLTIAVDTAKRRGTEDGELFDEIDPNAYYTLYGDRTWQNNDAESRYPLYVKLEKDSFQALFGDYETDLTDTDLGRYSRRLSGLKVDYESENVSITAFAAETNQTFMKDELAADGTSGPYRLQSAPIIRSSETIAVETRDRFRPDEVVNIRTLSRYIDYEIDYTTGELFFRYPIAAADPALNPNVIVVDYETASAGERGITAGGRAAARFADGKVETGVTVIHEEDGNSQGLDGSDLIAADVTVRLGQNEFRAELATSSAETEQGKRNGQALLLEAERRTAADMITNDSGRRIGATVGVDQIWQVNEAWTVGGGLARRANVDGGDQPLDVAPDAAVSPLEDGVRSALTNSESYTSGYLGAAYQVDNTAVSARAEMRDSATGERLVATLGGAREVTETLSFSAAARYQDEQLDEAADSKKLDVRIGAAWRPRGEGLILLNRFDVGSDEQEGQLKRTKVVNNLSANMMISDRTQAALYHGIKYVETEFEGAKADGVTQLVGGEVRHDVTKKLDLGLHGAWTSGDASGTDKWSFGPSIGYTPKENVWVSVGWNVSGFEDEDFEAARYTQQGPYIKLRAKFDQDTLKGVIKGLGLGAE